MVKLDQSVSVLHLAMQHNDGCKTTCKTKPKVDIIVLINDNSNCNAIKGRIIATGNPVYPKYNIATNESYIQGLNSSP